MQLGTLLSLAAAGAILPVSGLVTPRAPEQGIQAHPEGGFVFPRDSPDGTYLFAYDESGRVLNQTFTALDPRRDRVTVAARAAIGPRQFALPPASYLRCWGSQLPEGDWNLAWHFFAFERCKPFDPEEGFDGTNLPPGPNIGLGHRVGGAVAWMCSKAPRSNKCYGNEYDEWVHLFSRQCGGLTTGWCDYDGLGRAYGRNLASEPWCKSGN